MSSASFYWYCHHLASGQVQIISALTVDCLKMTCWFSLFHSYSKEEWHPCCWHNAPLEAWSQTIELWSPAQNLQILAASSSAPQPLLLNIKGHVSELASHARGVDDDAKCCRKARGWCWAGNQSYAGQQPAYLINGEDAVWSLTHPSIFCFPLSCAHCHKGCRYSLGPVAGLLQGRIERLTAIGTALTPTVNLDCGRKPENP